MPCSAAIEPDNLIVSSADDFVWTAFLHAFGSLVLVNLCTQQNCHIEVLLVLFFSHTETFSSPRFHSMQQLQSGLKKIAFKLSFSNRCHSNVKTAHNFCFATICMSVQTFSLSFISNLFFVWEMQIFRILQTVVIFYRST